MRVFALSDIHIDYSGNQQWIADLSRHDYQGDILILAGDVTDNLAKLEWCFKSLTACFKQVLFVPGNHDLWTLRDKLKIGSLEKFAQIRQMAQDCGVAMQTWQHGDLTLVPLLGWYDFSFGLPGAELLEAWMDFRACSWPDGFDAQTITRHFLRLNPPAPLVRTPHVISFSHFLPRIDVMHPGIPPERRMVYPVLGSDLLDIQVRACAPQIHVYGHSHVNRQVVIDGVKYINNAYGYPSETRIAAKQLLCIATL